MKQRLKKLNQVICKCRLCPRLVHFREHVPAKPQFEAETYWRRPVAGFGDEKAWLLLLGLAPSAQGGNRTGRIFTGDASAVFLMRALHREGFANQPYSESSDDGLKLLGCYLTAAVKCVPPQNRPLAKEINNCSQYLIQEMELLSQLKVVLALGRLAFDSYLEYARMRGASVKGITFKHGAKFEFEGLPILFASYHPSPQNTQTGVLNEKMFCALLKRVKRLGC